MVIYGKCYGMIYSLVNVTVWYGMEYCTVWYMVLYCKCYGMVIGKEYSFVYVTVL